MSLRPGEERLGELQLLKALMGGIGGGSEEWRGSGEGDWSLEQQTEELLELVRNSGSRAGVTTKETGRLQAWGR